MSDYRLYFMHPYSGHIERCASVEAPDDGGAMALASQHIGEYPLELWCDGRKVGRFEAQADVAPSRQHAA